MTRYHGLATYRASVLRTRRMRRSLSARRRISILPNLQRPSRSPRSPRSPPSPSKPKRQQPSQSRKAKQKPRAVHRHASPRRSRRCMGKRRKRRSRSLRMRPSQRMSTRRRWQKLKRNERSMPRRTSQYLLRRPKMLRPPPQSTMHYMALNMQKMALNMQKMWPGSASRQCRCRWTQLLGMVWWRLRPVDAQWASPVIKARPNQHQPAPKLPVLMILKILYGHLAAINVNCCNTCHMCSIYHIKS